LTIIINYESTRVFIHECTIKDSKIRHPDYREQADIPGHILPAISFCIASTFNLKVLLRQASLYCVNIFLEILNVEYDYYSEIFILILRNSVFFRLDQYFMKRH
jgi:hypothetical protein